MPLIRRIPFHFVLGLFAGWAVGALEAALVTSTTELVFPDPLYDSVLVALRYALVGGVFASALAFLPRKLRPDRAAPVLFITFAGLLFVSGTSWIHQVFFAGVAPLSFGPLMANGLLAGLCLAAGWGLGLVRAPVLAALVLAAGGHIGVLLTSSRDEPVAPNTVQAEAGAPNVLFLLIDTLRADHLQCYGYPKQTSPAIDALAQEGLRFDHAYAQATWTRPSVASLMTSLYPASHLTNSLHVRVPSELQTLAEVLKTVGYTTACFSANRNVSEVFGFAQGFDTFWTHDSDELNSIVRFTTWERFMDILRGLGMIGNPKPANQAEHLTDRALEWAEAHDGTPFFLYIQYIDPHGPYEPPAHFLEEAGIKPPSEELAAQVNPRHGQPPYPFYQVENVDEASLQRIVELYDAEIRYCDGEIGRLLDTLRASGMLDNTYIVVTSDHGEEFWEHKQFGHGQSGFEELAHVPLIIDGPGIAPGVVPGAVELIDLYPTIATWVGAAVPERIQGRDLGDLIAGGSRADVPEALIHNVKGYELAAWVFGREKLIRIEIKGEVTWMLYDLEADPLEQNDLSQQQPERLAELKNQLLARRAAAGRFRVGSVETAVIDEELREDLANLGYVEGDDGDSDSEDKNEE